MSTSAPFTLQLLGSPELRGPDGPVSGRAAHRRRIALLALLALARGRAVGRERLVGLLWPEHDGAAARHNLSESLYVLRKEVGDGVTAQGDEVRLDPAVVACDVAEFEEALQEGDGERAARAYRGPLLEGFYVADAPEFERWAEGERDRLSRAYTRTLEQLAEAAETEGSALRAVEWWRALSAHDPYSSRVALRLVRALDAAGERAAALRHASAHAALLREELGVDDDPELEEVVRRLRVEPVRTPAPPPPLRFAVGASAAVPPPPAAPEAAAPAPPAGIPPADVPPLVESREEERQTRPEGGPPRIFRLGRTVRYAAAVLLAVLAGAWAAWRGGPGAPAEAYDPRRLAVLYLDDHSPGEELRYLAGGLTESLIHELTQVEALDVVSRNGVKPFRDRAVPLDSIVRALRVGSVVEGSLQRSRDSLFVTVQLIDAATGSHLDSRVVGRPLGDVVALQRAVADEVAASLRRRLGEQVRLRQAREETASTEALALALRGEEVMADARRLAGERDPLDVSSAVRLLHRADSLLARAEAADPAWPRPTVLRGWVAVAMAGRPGVDRPDTLLDAARRRARRVLARHPGNARALELRGTAEFARTVAAVAAGGQPERLTRAEADLRAAVAAEPSLASAWSRLSQLLRYGGRFAEAEMAARRALEEDAYLDDAEDVLHSLYNSALALGDYRAAARWCAEGHARFPAEWRLLECRLTLLREDPAQPRDAALAWRLVERLDAMDPPVRARAAGRPYSPVYRRMVAASVSARAGDAARAWAEVARAREVVGTSPELRLSLLYDEAYVRLTLGERRAARRLLDELIAARPPLEQYLRRDPLFRELFTRSAASD